MNIQNAINKIRKLTTFVNMKVARFSKIGERKEAVGVYLEEKDVLVDLTKICPVSGNIKVEDLLENWNEKKEKILEYIKKFELIM